MKILMIIPGLDHRLGGTTTLSMGFYKELQKNAEVSLLSVYTPDELPYIDDEFIADPNVHLFLSIHKKLKYSRQLQSFVKNHIEEYDLVHIHGLWNLSTFPAAKIALKRNVPYIFSPHGMLEVDAMSRSKWKKKLIWNLGFDKLFKNAIAIHCTAQNEIVNTYRFDPSAKIIYIPNGVNIPNINLERRPNQLLFIGRLHPKKAVDRLIRAFSMIENEGLVLVIAGTGSKEYELMLNDLIKELKLEHHVEMVGFVQGKDKLNWIATSQIVIVPSFSEGMPLVSLESMSAGTPLLITKASNVPEVTEYNCGFELDNNDPKTIAEGLQILLDSDLKEKSNNAIGLIREKFLWEKVGSDLYRAYGELIDEKG